jgi:hypothetical protein
LRITSGASLSEEERSDAADLEEVEPENDDFNVRRKTPVCGLFLFFELGDHIEVALRMCENDCGHCL